MKTNQNNKIALFEGKQMRKTFYNGEWWFVLEDIIIALTNSVNPKDYISKMKKRDEELSKGWGQIVRILEMPTQGGIQKMNSVNTEGAFRIIQSIPSPKAEPFKLWLAKVGYERVQEIENPELAMKRVELTYEQKGYSKERVDKRMRGIAVRKTMTDEWKGRGIQQTDYGILTAEISKATFGMTPSQYKSYKGLDKPNQNLRDHMTDLELIFTMLGEASTTQIMKTEDSKGFDEVERASKRGGKIAGNARKALEEETNEKIISKENFLLKKENKRL